MPRRTVKPIPAPRFRTSRPAVGWAHAMNTPYQWTKQVASHWGGTRNGNCRHGDSETSATHMADLEWLHVLFRLGG
ncbi:hypothetical protein B8W69_12700 [Mycobacterium vulneris]|uniref:Uncharacterized protein n=1 Tax=Mycolicibacterium vulneris TaxID=547163 RepID=A0A1X2L2F3_9MYCO|nr:hypothetical protein B8W69_12700 [Mycolicibacterium vulneris]